MSEETDRAAAIETEPSQRSPAEASAREEAAVAGEDREAEFARLLAEERRQREAAEAALDALRLEMKAAEERHQSEGWEGSVRAELKRLGVAKVELAFRAVESGLRRAPGADAASGAELQEQLKRFVADNPEFLPPRIRGGSGSSAAFRTEERRLGVDLDKIRPGMAPELMEQARREIARIAAQTLRQR